MNPKVEARLEQVKRTSRSARRACLWLMVFAVAVASVTVATRLTNPGTFTCQVNGVRQACTEVSPPAMTIAFGTIIASVALVLTGLYRLARLFGNYSRGEIFTRDSVREIRWLGYLTVAYTVLQGVLFVVTLLLVPPGEAGWPTELRFDLPLAPAALASFITLLSWVMDVGAELREESELTV